MEVRIVIVAVTLWLGFTLYVLGDPSLREQVRHAAAVHSYNRRPVVRERDVAKCMAIYGPAQWTSCPYYIERR